MGLEPDHGARLGRPLAHRAGEAGVRVVELVGEPWELQPSSQCRGTRIRALTGGRSRSGLPHLLSPPTGTAGALAVEEVEEGLSFDRWAARTDVESHNWMVVTSGLI